MRLRRWLPHPTHRQTAADEPWPDTQPGDWLAQAAATRCQPPLTEVLQGLDARELEGQTVFDQHFGNVPAA